jgi:tol-pal system protein YbgF
MKPRLGLSDKGWGIMKRVVLTILLVVVAAVPQSFAQDKNLQALLDRMERLERDIKTINVHLHKGGPLPAASAGATHETDPGVARLGVRLTELEEELRATTGRIEGLTHLVNQINGRMDKLVGDIDYRLGALERSTPATTEQPGVAALPPPVSATPSPPVMTAAPTPSPVQTVAPGTGTTGFATQPQSLGTVSRSAVQSVGTPPAQPTQPAKPAPAAQAAPTASGTLPAGTPADQYKYAFGLLRQNQFDKAEVALTAFIETHAGDPLTANARYWLGETYYVRQDYERAARTFFDGYNQSPQGPKAAGSLLKLGMSLSHLEKPEDACITFAKLEQEFPDASPSVKTVMNRERQRNACQ